MKWVPDDTHGLEFRPHYEPGEIDEICDNQITNFLLERFDTVKMPIPTDAIEMLIERETQEYDPYADLSGEDGQIEGMTRFFKNKKPSVFISERLSKHYKYENRRRTTLTHELGHVKIHAPLWSEIDGEEIKCNRDGIRGRNNYDWMEWQAYYASGAYLMPLSQMKLLVNEILKLGFTSGPFYINSSPGRGLIQHAKNKFSVSKAAVLVRLAQLGFITENLNEAVVLE